MDSDSIKVVLFSVLGVLILIACVTFLFPGGPAPNRNLFQNPQSFSTGIVYPNIKTLSDVLFDLGIEQSNTPIQSAKFNSITQPKITVLYRESAGEQEIGWYSENKLTSIIQSVENAKVTKTFAEKDTEFGLYLNMSFDQDYQWFTETEKNSDGSHIQIYPNYENGKKAENSYVIAWEDWSLNRDRDYNDLVIQIDGVEIVTDKNTDSN